MFIPGLGWSESAWATVREPETPKQRNKTIEGRRQEQELLNILTLSGSDTEVLKIPRSLEVRKTGGEKNKKG